MESIERECKFRINTYKMFEILKNARNGLQFKCYFFFSLFSTFQPYHILDLATTHLIQPKNYILDCSSDLWQEEKRSKKMSRGKRMKRMKRSKKSRRRKRRRRMERR